MIRGTYAKDKQPVTLHVKTIKLMWEITRRAKTTDFTIKACLNMKQNILRSSAIIVSSTISFLSFLTWGLSPSVIEWRKSPSANLVLPWSWFVHCAKAGHPSNHVGRAPRKNPRHWFQLLATDATLTSSEEGRKAGWYSNIVFPLGHGPFIGLQKLFYTRVVWS